MFLDDNEDLRSLLSELIEVRLKTKCLGVGSFQGMISKAIEVLNSKVAILDIELGINAPSGIEAYQWLIDNRYRGHIYFLTGHGQSHPLVQKALQSGATVWEKPTSANIIISEISQYLAPSFQETELQL